jgi:NodT family efflux transporter outer membrane factor (OMF) lipoprotein
MAVKKLLIGISILGLAGCAHLTDLSGKQEIPSGWTNKQVAVGDAAVQEKWWAQFNDPTLNVLIDKAVKQNYDLKIAETRIRAARAQLLSVEASYLPDVNANASAERSRGSKSVHFGQYSGGTYSLYDTELDSTWEVNIFGVGSATAAAEATIAATYEDKYGVLLSLLGEVTTNYIELRRLQQNLILTDSTIAAYQSSLKIADIRQKAGLTTMLDTVRAQAALQSAEAQRPQIATQINASIRRLEVLLGQNPDTLDSVLAATGGIPASASPILLATPAAVIANRPDIREAEQTLRAQKETRTLATEEYLPSINLPMAFGWQAQNNANLGTNNALIWALTGGITVPVFDFGRIRADINLADANAEQAYLNYQKTVTGALSDVETALSDYLAAVNAEPKLDDAVKSNQAAVDLSQERYKSGLINQLDVLDAQRSLYTAQQAQLQNQADEASRLVTLYKAMGGGWHSFADVKPVIPAATVAAPISAVPAIQPSAAAPAPNVKTETMGDTAVTVIE